MALDGYAMGVETKTKELIYYPGRKFVLLGSVAAVLMIPFPGEVGDE